MQFRDFIQSVIVVASVVFVPGLLQLPGYWSGVVFYGMAIGLPAWSWYRFSVHGRGPFW